MSFRAYRLGDFNDGRKKRGKKIPVRLVMLFDSTGINYFFSLILSIYFFFASSDIFYPSWSIFDRLFVIHTSYST